MSVQQHRGQVRTVRTILTAALVILTIVGCAASGNSEPGADPSFTESPRTLRSLINAPAQAPSLSVIEELPGTDLYTAAVVSYESDGLNISAVLRTPVGAGPFPGLVLVHGSIDPDAWSSEDAYPEQMLLLAEAGWVTLVTDLRNYGPSDDDPVWEFDLEMGTTADAVHAARALDAEPNVSSVAMLGHSMGGGIALNALVVAPDVATAFVALAPSNPSPWVNLKSDQARTPHYEEIVALRGTPDSDPQFWADVTSTTFAERATAPLLIVHGTADQIAPLAWSKETAAAFRAAGADVELVVLNGADHYFQPDPKAPWAPVIAFLESHR